MGFSVQCPGWLFVVAVVVFVVLSGCLVWGFYRLRRLLSVVVVVVVVIAIIIKPL